MMKGVLIWILIAILIVMIGGTAIYVATRDNYYIVDKGYALSYVDEYGLTHDDVFWLVLSNQETNNRLTLFVSPYTWYTYSVGGRYTGSVRAGIVYEGDDSIARYLKDGNH